MPGGDEEEKGRCMKMQKNKRYDPTNEIDRKEFILSRFKIGLTIESISTTIFYQEKQFNKQITRWETRKIVEETILEDYLETRVRSDQGEGRN